jgi:hypothetical protein
MAITVDDRRDPHVVPFGQPPVAVQLYRPIPSARPRSTSILPMYVRLARLPEPGRPCSADEPRLLFLSIADT